MSAEIRVPKERTCQRCGRAEVWDEASENWVVDGDAVGDVFCIHSWDITGEFAPLE
ncbi:MAG: HEWD family protein [Halobacteriaceae archaeon]